MALKEQDKSEIITSPTYLINDENNNSTFTNRFGRKDSERMIVIPDTSSDEEYLCSSCSSTDDSDLISLDTRKLWHDIAHLIKCIYRETNREFLANHSTNDICKAKESVQILTQLDAECLFNQIETIVLEYVDELRNQVSKRFQTCLKTSNDVQLFISYLLDEYQTFIQAAKNVSIIVSYLEEHYLKSFHLTWLLYNKHLYEKLVYMDKKIQHSMSTMIDLLQPSNEHQKNDYSPAEYTQLLNRFLAFDEEMSEITCVYKDCQKRMTALAGSSSRKDNQLGLVVQTKKKKKICKKFKKNPNKLVLNSSLTTAVDIPFSNTAPIVTPAGSQQGSNGSSIGSGVGGKESSSMSSFDEDLLDNHTSSSSYTKEDSADRLVQPTANDLHEQFFQEILNDQSSTTDIPVEIDHQMKTEERQIVADLPAKKLKSSRRKGSSAKTTLTPEIIVPPKPPSSTASKLQADFRPLNMPLLRKSELPTCPSLLSAKMQSVSFTAGTFGSITSNESSPPNHSKRLNINLSQRFHSVMKSESHNVRHNLDQLLRQATSTEDISTLLSTLESCQGRDDASSLDKTCDFCSYDFLSETNALSTPTCVTCCPNQRENIVRERLQLKLSKHSTPDPSDQPTKSSGKTKSKVKPCDNNIDDLVRFIDGKEPAVEEVVVKKSKKKEKNIRTNPSNEQTKVIKTENTVEPAPSLSKRKQKEKLKRQQQEKELEESSTTPPPPLNPPPALPKKPDSVASNTALSLDTSSPPEEEVNWITISRKQGKHKPPTTSIPSLLATPIAPLNTTKQKVQPTKVKTKKPNTSTPPQPKIPAETVSNSNKSQTAASPVLSRAQKSLANSTSQQKSEIPSAWTTHEPIQVTPSSILVATTPAFVPASSLLKSKQIIEALPLDENRSSLYWKPNDYLLPTDSTPRSASIFSPAPGPLNPTRSRCIQRPSSETRTSTFPTYAPMNCTVNNSNSTWSDAATTSTTEAPWKYSRDEQFLPSTIPDSFPLYDPFNSGAGLTIPSAALFNGGFDFSPSRNNDVDEMDAFDKEIEDFKKCYIDNIPSDPRDKVQVNRNS